MDAESFFLDLRQDILLRADSTENFTDEAFAEVVTEYLVDAGSIEEFVPCKYIHRGVRIDGYALNWDEALLELFVVDCRSGATPERMMKADMEQMFRRAESFFEKACLARFVDQMEAAHPAYGLARTILEQSAQIGRVRFYLLSNASLTNTVKELPPRTENGREYSYRVWDLDRLARTVGSGEAEEIQVDFEEMFGHPLICLPADDGNGEVKCFLCVIPGEWLAAIYDRYGGRLLEQNVRTFLQARGKVNKGIRKTILEEPRRFFPYNNGISATAEEIDADRQGGIATVRRLKNLQIVNGGQTTASIFNAAKKDKGAPIDQVSVQMKLSIVKAEEAEELVPKISRFANSQNRISDSDFFSNHPFHVLLENLSRHVPAPAKEGSQILTHWFYERAKGQYANATAYLSGPRKKEFESRHPRDQVISKTDLAKYVQTFRELPYDVSLGAQKNFAKFADHASAIWDQRKDDFNELWFRRAVVEAIIFRRAEKAVLKAPWYAQGYRANTVTYGIALLMNRIRASKHELDVQRMWRDQAMPEALERELLECCRVSQEAIIEGAERNGVINVTEWAKRKTCWDLVVALPDRLPAGLIQVLRELDEDRVDARDARREQKALGGAEAHIAVISAGAEFWKKVKTWAASSDDVKPSDLLLLDIAVAIPRRLPNEKASSRLMEIKSLFEGK